jgi:hypothetical protein
MSTSSTDGQQLSSSAPADLTRQVSAPAALGRQGSRRSRSSFSFSAPTEEDEDEEGEELEPEPTGFFQKLWRRHTNFIAHPDYLDKAELSDCIPGWSNDYWVNRVLEITSLIVILVSVAAFCLETLPQYRMDEYGVENADPHPTFYMIEAVCIGWFTIEYIWRLFVAEGKMEFILDGMNLVDLIAILPFYIAFLLPSGQGSQLTIVRILRLSRVSRLFKVSRHSSGLQDMVTCIAASKSELALFFLITAVATILFASAIFYAEKDVPDTNFISIPAAFWWAIVTMTTVGYGDMVPDTVGGKVIAGVCASLGVVLLAIPAGIFISEFMTMHEAKKREKTIDDGSDMEAALEYHLSDALELASILESAKTDKAMAKHHQPEPDDSEESEAEHGGEEEGGEDDPLLPMSSVMQGELQSAQWPVHGSSALELHDIVEGMTPPPSPGPYVSKVPAPPSFTVSSKMVVEEEEDNAEENMDDEDEDELRAIFHDFDEDRSGHLCSREISAAAAAMGYPMSLNELVAAMEFMDLNHDDQVTFENFARWWNRDHAAVGDHVPDHHKVHEHKGDALADAVSPSKDTSQWRVARDSADGDFLATISAVLADDSFNSSDGAAGAPASPFAITTPKPGFDGTAPDDDEGLLVFTTGTTRKLADGVVQTTIV